MTGIQSLANGVSTSKPKLLFVYDIKNEDYWKDGLWAALNLLEQDFEITRWNISKQTPLEAGVVATYKWNFVLGWGGFNSPVDRWIQVGKDLYETPIRRGLCIGGNAHPPTGADNYDVLFYETKWYRDQIKLHPNIVHAFGINADLYNDPELPFPIVWDYISVGSLAAWKRHEKIFEKQGRRLVIGEYQEGNEQESLEIARELLKNGVAVSPLTNPFDYSLLLHCSRTAYIPATVIGGGERAVLEARACGLHVEIEADNPKLQELITSPIYDHYYYAKQLKKGILSVL